MRNPDNYIRECIEVGVSQLAWDFGVLRKRAIDPYKFCSLYYGVERWQSLVIANNGARLLDNEHPMDAPKAVFPVWEYGGSWENLEKLAACSVGEDPKACSDPDLPLALRPVLGQEHRVVIAHPPAGNTGLGRAFYRSLSELQEEYPDCILHVHGLYSFRLMFALEYKSVDYEPRTLAQKGKVILPTGKEVTYEYATQEPHWINLLGMKPVELKIPRNRCMYNIRSALWAGENFKQSIKFRTRGFSHVDPDDPIKRAPTMRTIMVRRVKPQEGDKYLCDTCSLQVACKYFRQGAVCIVPESEPVELARFFKTRDADTIIDGLGTLLATETRRLEKALESEEDKGELHPETTKIINTLFDRGVKLAKLLDPRLAAAGAPKITQNNLGVITASTPQQLMSQIVEMFVQQGIPRSQITPDMVLRVIQQPEEIRQQAIDVASQEARSA